MADECVFREVEVKNYLVVSGDGGRELVPRGKVKINICQHQYVSPNGPYLGMAQVGSELPQAVGLDYNVPGTRKFHVIPKIIAGA